jgi:hypothetical protein
MMLLQPISLEPARSLLAFVAGAMTGELLWQVAAWLAGEVDDG